MSNSVGFIACTMLYNYHIYLIPKHLLHPKETSYSLNSHSPFSTPLAPRNHYPLPVYMDLLILDISYTWNYMISSLLCLASLSYSDVLEVHTLCSMYRHTKKAARKKIFFRFFTSNSNTPTVSLLKIKMTNIISHQGNTNQNHNEVSLHSHWNDYIFLNNRI